MILQLTFRPRAFASEIAVLGERLVGEILPCPGPRHRATWLVRLPDWPRSQGPASSFEAARRKIENEVNEWFRSVGAFGPGDGVRVRVEATEKEKARA